MSLAQIQNSIIIEIGILEDATGGLVLTFPRRLTILDVNVLSGTTVGGGTLSFTPGASVPIVMAVAGALERSTGAPGLTIDKGDTLTLTTNDASLIGTVTLICVASPSQSIPIAPAV